METRLNDKAPSTMSDAEIVDEVKQLQADDRCRVTSRALDLMWFARLRALNDEWRKRIQAAVDALH